MSENTPKPKQPRVVLKAVDNSRSADDSNNNAGLILAGVLFFLLVISVAGMLIFQEDISNTFFKSNQLQESEVITIPDTIAIIQAETDVEKLVREYLNYQDNRNMFELSKCWSSQTDKYYDYKDLSSEEVYNLIQQSWDNTIKSKNTILQISRLDERTVQAEIQFDYTLRRSGEVCSVQSINVYSFNPDGKLISEYQRFVSPNPCKTISDSEEVGIEQKYINSDNVNLRVGPTFERFTKNEGVFMINVIDVLSKGELVEGRGGAVNNDGSRSILRVSFLAEFGNEKLTLPIGGVVTVLSDNGAESQCKFTLPDNSLTDSFTVPNQYLEPATNYDWIRVLVNGKEGYVLEKYISGP
jgi:hypothetical protein